MISDSTSEYISYAEILNSFNDFRRAGGRSKNDFNETDNPGFKYFKIFFHFYNGSADTGDEAGEFSGGLLFPIFDSMGDSKADWDNDDLRKYTCAWTYLKLNKEDERASHLEDFIRLLSNISSYSPWYFQSIEGLESAIERKYVNDKEFKFEEDRQKLTIKCLQDAVDDRIGTMLDLYRSIVYSQSMKRYILPGNLRKFDMSIVVFEAPIKTMHNSKHPAIINTNSQISSSNDYKSSYKYYEFHNCEIDYSSTKTASTLNNVEGIKQEYSIDISYDDMYENRYNEFLAKNIGDFVAEDMDLLSAGVIPDSKISNSVIESGYKKLSDNLGLYDNDITLEQSAASDSKKLFSHQTMLNKAVNMVSGELKETVGSVMEAGPNIIRQIAGGAIKTNTDQLKKVVLGNLYGFSVTDTVDKVQQILSGDIYMASKAAQKYIGNKNVSVENPNMSRDSLYEPVEQNTTQISNSGMFEDAVPYEENFSMQTLAYDRYERKVTDRVISVGNMFKKQSMANNI